MLYQKHSKDKRAVEEKNNKGNPKNFKKILEKTFENLKKEYI